MIHDNILPGNVFVFREDFSEDELWFSCRTKPPSKGDVAVVIAVSKQYNDDSVTVLFNDGIVLVSIDWYVGLFADGSAISLTKREQK